MVSHMPPRANTRHVTNRLTALLVQEGDQPDASMSPRPGCSPCARRASGASPSRRSGTAWLCPWPSPRAPRVRPAGSLAAKISRDHCFVWQPDFSGCLGSGGCKVIWALAAMWHNQMGNQTGKHFLQAGRPRWQGNWPHCWQAWGQELLAVLPEQARGAREQLAAQLDEGRLRGRAPGSPGGGPAASPSSAICCVRWLIFACLLACDGQSSLRASALMGFGLGLEAGVAGWSQHCVIDLKCGHKCQQHTCSMLMCSSTRRGISHSHALLCAFGSKRLPVIPQRAQLPGNLPVCPLQGAAGLNGIDTAHLLSVLQQNSDSAARHGRCCPRGGCS